MAATPSASASARQPVASSSPSAAGLSNIELRFTLRKLRFYLRAAYARGRDGRPFQSPPAIVAAVRQWFGDLRADPSYLNGASRVVFLGVENVPRAGELHSSADRQYVSALFWADGPEMVAAGNLAPGLNVGFLLVSRQSPDGPWHAEGLIYP